MRIAADTVGAFSDLDDFGSYGFGQGFMATSCVKMQRNQLICEDGHSLQDAEIKGLLTVSAFAERVLLKLELGALNPLARFH